ncbi:MAG: hypothetical protein AAAFM81_08865 [Pseudomonadota bacterium]
MNVRSILAITVPFMLLLTSCVTQEAPQQTVEVASSDATEAGAKEASEVPRSRRVYYFQHRMMPQWLFESNGEFFNDMMLGYRMSLRDAAEEVVDADFAGALHVDYNETYDAVLFSFEAPDSPPNCFFVALQRTNDGFRFITYESTIPLDDDVVGVVGEWRENGNHGNLGPRSYRTLEAFADDMLRDGE